jgi:hypothetical protein
LPQNCREEFGVEKGQGRKKISGKMAELEAMDEESEALIPFVTGGFPVTEFGLREKKKKELKRKALREN